MNLTQQRNRLMTVLCRDFNCPTYLPSSVSSSRRGAPFVLC